MSEKVNIMLDASMLDMLQLCKERFHNRYVLNKVAPKKARQLDRGTVVHYGNELYYQALKEGVPFHLAVKKGLDGMRELGVSASDLEVEDIGRILEVMHECWEYWRIEDQNIEILAVETPFTYLLHEDDLVRIFMSGKIDLLVNHKNYINLPIDHKSYDRSYETRRLSNQFINYANAVDSNYLFVNKIGFQKTLPAEQKFKRIPLSFDPLYKEQWKQNVVNTIYQDYLPCLAEDKWPMNLTSCDKFNRICEYHELCDSSGIEAKFYKLNANYVDAEIWDVTKVLTKGDIGEEL